MLPFYEHDEEPEISPILTDKWDSGYGSNEFTDASNMSFVETEYDSDLEPGEAIKLSGLQRSAEPISRLNIFKEGSDTEDDYLALEAIYLKPETERNKRPYVNRWNVKRQPHDYWYS